MKTILFFTFLAVACTIIAVLKEEELEDNSVELTKWLHEYELIKNNFSSIGEYTGTVFLLISGTLYLIGKRDIGLLGMICGLLGVYISGALKIGFAHPRPFWKYSKIEGEDCPKDYGTPSGHAMSAGGGLFILSYVWIKTTDSKFWKKIIGIIVTFTAIITAFDRVYIGVHFHFQVILGYIYAALVVAVLVHPKSLEYIKSFKTNAKSVIQAHAALAVSLIIGIFIYELRNPLWSPIWAENYKERCPTNTGLEAHSPMIKSFGETNIVMFIAGMIAGVYFLKNKNKPCPNSWILLFFISALLHQFLMDYFKSWDKYILKNFTGLTLIFVLSISRYLFGFTHTFILPLLLSRLFGEKNPHDTDVSFHWNKYKTN